MISNADEIYKMFFGSRNNDFCRFFLQHKKKEEMREKPSFFQKKKSKNLHFLGTKKNLIFQRSDPFKAFFLRQFNCRILRQFNCRMNCRNEFL